VNAVAWVLLLYGVASTVLMVIFRAERDESRRALSKLVERVVFDIPEEGSEKDE
jgi:hypothetical protein